MGGICFSVAPILRCEDLTRLQSGVLIVPAALEVVFSLGLLMIRRAYNRNQLLLASDGVFYFFLAFLDLLSHQIPSVGRSLSVFKPLDIFIGSASLIPILLYTLFLLLLTTAEIVSVFGARLQTIGKYTLIMLIPAIIVANELGSFFSISYQISGPGSPAVIDMGFKNQSLKMDFDDLTLALLTIFQVLALFFASSRLYKAFHPQRRPTSVSDTTKVKAMQIRGLGWIVAGLSLGTIEVAVGFASGGFAVAMARRALRFLSRAALLFGVIQGVDTVENFRLFSPESARDRRSNLRALISNPRASTFQKVGGHDFEFDPERAPVSERSPTVLTKTAFTLPRPPPVPASPQPSFSDRYDRESSIYSTMTTPTTARHTRLIALHLSDEISLSDTPRSSVKSVLTRASQVQVTPMSAVFSTVATDVAIEAATPTPSTSRSWTPMPLPPLQDNLSRSRLQRVTVHYDSQMRSAPFLELRRISQLDLGSMLTNLDHFHEPAGLRTKSMPNPWDVDTPAVARDDTDILRSPTRVGTIQASRQLQFRRTLAGIESGRHNIVSASTVASLDVVHALAGQFPATPTSALPAAILAALKKPVEQPEDKVQEQQQSEEHVEEPAEEPSGEQLEEQIKTPTRPESALSRPSSMRRSSVNNIALQRTPSVQRKSVPSLEALTKSMSQTRTSVPLARASMSSISSSSVYSTRPRPGSTYSTISETSIPSEERARKAMTLPAKAKPQELPDFTNAPSLPTNIMPVSDQVEHTDVLHEEAEITPTPEPEPILTSEPQSLSPTEETNEELSQPAMSRRRSGSLSTIVLTAESLTEKIRGRNRAATISSASFSADDISPISPAEERRRKSRTLPPRHRSGTLPKSLFFKAQALRRDSAESNSSTESELADEPISTFRIDLHVAGADTDSSDSSSSDKDRSRKVKTLPAKAREEQKRVELSNKRQTMVPLNTKPVQSSTLASPPSPPPLPSPVAPRPCSPSARAMKAMTLPPQGRSPLDESAVPDLPEVGDKSSERKGRSRTKSVGSAPKRQTPTPTQTFFGRNSIVVEWVVAPVRVLDDSKMSGSNKLRKRSKSRPRASAEVARAAEVSAEGSI